MDAQWQMNNKKQQHEIVTTTMGRNLQKLLGVGQLILEIDFRSDGPPVVVVAAAAAAAVTVSCCCCPAIVIVYVQLQMESQQKQHYTVTAIIKRLMITKILNNLVDLSVCCCCLIFLFIFIEKTSVMQ